MPIDILKVKWDETPQPPAGSGIDLSGVKWDATISSAKFPRWDDVKDRLPEDMRARYEDRVKNALSLSAAMDVPLSLSYELHDNFIEKFKETNLWDKAQGSFKAGWGDVYSTFGNTLKWLGANKDFADTYTDFGERLRAAYIPPADISEFTWGKMKDPEYLATSGIRTVPFFLSLIPAAIVGAYAGATTAGAIGLGAFGTYVLGAIGGATLGSPIEFAFEAGGVYEEALKKGMTEREANEAANKTFKGNMALTGTNAAQFALAFIPLRIAGKSATRALALRVLATTGKLGAVGLSEAMEERYQETIAMKSLGEDVSFFNLKDPRLNEASAIGAIFGVGLGGAGSVWAGLTNHIVNTMPKDVRAEYDAQKAEDKTDIEALDSIAETPEGKAHIENAIETLKSAVEDTSRPEAEMKPVETESETSSPETEPIAEKAVLDLLAEGREFEDITDEDIEEKIRSYEQAPIRPETAPAGVEAGISPEASVNGPSEGKNTVYQAVYEQIKAISPVGTADTDIQAQATLYESFFRTMGQRIGVSPAELFGRYQVSIEKELPRKVAVNEDGSLHFTKSQRTTLELAKGEIEQGEAGKRLFVDTSQEPGPERYRVIGVSSSFPDYFQNKGYTKKETLNAIDKALAGKKLGKRQLSIVQDLNEGYRRQAADGWRRMRSEERRANIPEGMMEDPETSEMLSQEEWTRRYFQGKKKTPRGRITFGTEGVNITLLQNADMSTFLHETAHFYLKVMEDLGRVETAPADIKTDLKIVLDWLGAKSVDEITAKQHERFARGFEKYLAEGNAPSVKLRNAFARFKEWLTEVYRQLKSLKVSLNDDVRAVMDRMLATKEEIKAAAEAEKVTGKAAKLASVLPIRAVKGQIERATGLKDVVRLIREDEALSAAWKKAEQNARTAFREGKREALAEAQAEMADVVSKIRAGIERKKITAQLKRIKDKNVKSNIAIEYKKKIDELLEGIDFKNLTDKKRKNLIGLASFIEKEGVPLGIQGKYLKELRRLSQKQLKDMTTKDLRTLKDTVKHLNAIGKLKQKLLKFADEKDRQVRLNRLMEDTVNLDIRPPQTRLQSKMTRSKLHTWMDGAQKVYIETLHTFRVADRMDGFKNGQGENTRLIKNMNEAEQRYHRANTDRVAAFLEKRTELLGDSFLTEKEYAAIAIHGRFQEGSYDAVKTLAEKYKFNIPDDAVITTTEELREYVPITDNHLKYVSLIRETVTAKTDDIAALHEELTNEPFDRVDGYFSPRLYEKEAAIEPEAMLREDFKDTDVSGNYIARTKKTAQGFTKRRVEGVQKTPRIDAEVIVAEALSAQEWYLNMQPVLLDTAELVYSKEYMEKAGTVASNWWKDQIDIVARKGWKAGYRPNAASNLLKTIRGNLNKSILLFKASTVMMQPFAVIDAMAYAQAKFGPKTVGRIGAKFLKIWFIPRYADKIIEASEALKQRQGGEVALEEVLREASRKDHILGKWERLGASFIIKADVKTAAAVKKGFETTLKELGVENAEAEADFLMNLTQGSSGITFRPHILSSGEMAKTLFTFQTFFLNRWGLIIHDIIIGGIVKGNYKAKTAALVAIGLMMLGGLTEDEARKRLVDSIRALMGKESLKRKEEDYIMDIIAYLPEQMPVLGNFAEGAKRGFGGELPLQRATGKVFTGVFRDIPSGKVKKGLLKTGEGAITIRKGIPGIAQAFDILEILFEEEKNKSPRARVGR